MRLLIVEDEYYTRQGIIEGIDLEAIGFDEVEQADDGVNALRVARVFRPDVVLADVRMPRMDGVEMCYSLRKHFPDCSIVFMSGYADKEYLKAAIDLKATSYIEKPFRTQELRDVLDRAVTLRRQEKERERREAELLARAEAGTPLLRSEAALMLVQHDPDDSRVRRALEISGLCLSAATVLVVAVIRPAGVHFADETAFRERFPAIADAEIARASLQGLAAVKGSESAVLVLAGPADRPRALGEKEVSVLLEKVLRSLGREEFIAGASSPVIGVAGARAAYAAATSALEAAFFAGPGAIAHDSSSGRRDLAIESGAIDDFQSCLDREDGDGALVLLRAHAAVMQASASRDTFRAREHLTRILLRLVAFAERRGIDPFAEGESVRFITESIERAGTLRSARAILEPLLGRIFERLSLQAADGKVVSSIKRAIHHGYPMPGLSIDDIAREAGVSSTYACRLFKEATGETIHRYMTAYRLERAKDLLRDPRQPKMAEIAARAGFSDPNYFARAFRRATGQSPSEYREDLRP